ncbi:MAG: phosphodiester glycosidase family protein [Gaiellaceae bacterium]
MLRRLGALIIAALAALSSIASAGAAPRTPRQTTEPVELMPGVVYQKRVQFTPHGPVVMHVLSGPKPGGLYSLRPILSNETITGTESLTAMEQRLSPVSTIAAVNGDFFNAKDGHPTGMLVRDGSLESVPFAKRSSIGIGLDGLLRAALVSSVARWQGNGQGRPLGLNLVTAPNAVTLFTPAYGAATPPRSGSVEAIFSSFPPVKPESSFSATVSQVKTGGSTPIPPGGAVLVGTGSQAAIVQAEVPVGQTVNLRFILLPHWSDLSGALGGGPVLVRSGKPVFTVKEALDAGQLMARSARSAIGQTADGKVLLVSVDGGQPGYSTGVTNFDLAQAMAQLGAVTAVGLSSGTTTTMAFDGKLLNRPSVGEQPLGDALGIFYDGAYAPPPSEPVLSPNGDGVAESQSLSYKLVRPSTVSAQLVGPDHVARFSDSGAEAPGTYNLAWTGKTAEDQPEPEGVWHWTVSATDDLGRSSSIDRSFWLNDTLGFLSVQPSLVRVGPHGGALQIGVQVMRSALVTVDIASAGGVLLKTMAREVSAPGPVSFTWTGRDAGGKFVHSGRYQVTVSAENSVGPVELSQSFALRRVA